MTDFFGSLSGVGLEEMYNHYNFEIYDPDKKRIKGAYYGIIQNNDGRYNSIECANAFFISESPGWPDFLRENDGFLVLEAGYLVGNKNMQALITRIKKAVSQLNNEEIGLDILAEELRKGADFIAYYPKRSKLF